MYWDYLNNASVAAFLGALFAFLLVALTDIRRRHRTKRLLKELVADNLDLARVKLESVETNISLLRKDNKITNSPIMGFPAHAIRESQHQVLDLLDANEKQGLDALVYWMEAIDACLRDATARATELKEAIRRDAPTNERNAIAGVYMEEMEDVRRNLRHLMRLLQYYIEGKPHQILEYYHSIDDDG